MEPNWQELSETLMRESDRLDDLSRLLEDIPDILVHAPERIPELMGRMGEEELALFHVREAHQEIRNHLRIPCGPGPLSGQRLLSVSPSGFHQALHRWNQARVRLQSMTLRAAIHLRRFALINRRMMEHLQNLMPRNYSPSGLEQAACPQGTRLLMEA